MPQTFTPFRYPGGKTKLYPFVSRLVAKNQLMDGHFVEPYAGGAGLATSLLIRGIIRHLHLNDLDRSVYALWHTILYHTTSLCEYIETVKIDMDEWYRQKMVQENKGDADLLALGLSTFFLNRTNRAGILAGGVMGGKNQTGKYKLGDRFNRNELIAKVRMLHFYKSRIRIYNQDAMDFLENHADNFPEKTIICIDPPYYGKGHQLYHHAYGHHEHREIARKISKIKPFWFATYDNEKAIRDLYSSFPVFEYNLSYGTQRQREGKELFIPDPRLVLPDTEISRAA